MPEPRYDARTVVAPDGTRITVAYKPGSPIGTMSDKQFLAEIRPVLTRVTDTTRDKLPDNVTNLAAERLKRHPQTAPYTADDIAPLLDGPRPRQHAEHIATLINQIIQFRLGHRP
jgi:hypothetical protein